MFIAILLAATAPQSALPETVTYDEAVACAFIGIAYGMRAEHSDDAKREITGLGVRYMEFAKSIGGKSDAEVVADMEPISGNIMARAQATANPLGAIRSQWDVCVERSGLLPTAE